MFDRRFRQPFRGTLPVFLRPNLFELKEYLFLRMPQFKTRTAKRYTRVIYPDTPAHALELQLLVPPESLACERVRQTGHQVWTERRFRWNQSQDGRKAVLF